VFKNPKPLSAGKLIEQCGLKGTRIGGAQVSEIQANFIVNLDNATSKDVLELIKLCKQKVKEKFNIDLEAEIVIL
jgi:UDP-N-acetylmuramate dehydrogenase